MENRDAAWGWGFEQSWVVYNDAWQADEVGVHC